MSNKYKMRRSIVASKDLKIGKKIEITDLDFKDLEMEYRPLTIKR